MRMMRRGLLLDQALIRCWDFLLSAFRMGWLWDKEDAILNGYTWRRSEQDAEMNSGLTTWWFKQNPGWAVLLFREKINI